MYIYIYTYPNPNWYPAHVFFLHATCINKCQTSYQQNIQHHATCLVLRMIAYIILYNISYTAYRFFSCLPMMPPGSSSSPLVPLLRAPRIRGIRALAPRRRSSRVRWRRSAAHWMRRVPPWIGRPSQVRSSSHGCHGAMGWLRYISIWDIYG